ncbi:MAG: S8 family serine peptidase [Runella sp.]
MKKTQKIVSVAILAAGAMTMSGCHSEQESEMKPNVNVTVTPRQGHYIVTYKEDPLAGARIPNLYDARMEFMGEFTKSFLIKRGISADRVEYVYETALKGFAAELTATEVVKLRQDPNIGEIVEDNIITLDDPEVEIQIEPNPQLETAATQETPWGITRVGGAAAPAGGVKVYVIDTGINLTHPDLNVDASLGYNAFDSRTVDGRNLDDGNGHGTHVAGTIGARNNSIGVIGVAAGVKVIPIKVLGSNGSGSTSGVIAGVNFVGNRAAQNDIANMSLGGGINTALDAAVVNASNAKGGIKFVLAAGNSNANANNSSPARANGPHVVTVSAHDINNVRASFTNWGRPPIDFCAPGVSIKSTYRNKGYAILSGTSMAAPHVAGIMAASASRTVNTSGTVANNGFNDPRARR